MDLFDLIIFIARPSKKGEIMSYKMSKIKSQKEPVIYIQELEELEYILKNLAKMLQLDFHFPWKFENAKEDDGFANVIVYAILLELGIYIYSENAVVTERLDEIRKDLTNGKYKNYLEKKI